MLHKAVILALLSACLSFGASAIYNVPYRPQPRILIPTVEPSQTIVSTNGAVIANTNRNLRLCDFYLAAIDQTGSLTNPILFEYSSVSTNEQSAAVVFYQRSGPDYPASLLRRLGATLTVTNEIITVTNQTVGIFTNWNLVVSATNYPAWVYVNGDSVYCYKSTESSKTVWYSSTSNKTLYAPIFTNGNSSFVYAYAATSNGGSQYAYYNMAHIGSTTTLLSWVVGDFVRSGVVAPEQTNFWYQQDFTNVSYKVVSANILSVAAASSNEASAIEVFPIRQGQKWMKQTNPNVKWMCLLSNGVEWYSTASGDPIWFNCQVDWVDRIPEILQ